MAAELSAADRIALAERLGAEIKADPEGHDCLHPEAVAEFLLIAAASRNRHLGLVQDTPQAAAQRETERRARVQAVIDQIGA